jgi:hypothetical protein
VERAEGREGAVSAVFENVILAVAVVIWALWMLGAIDE